MLLRSSITKCRCRLINVGTTGLEWALDLEFCLLGYSRLSTCRSGEILPQNVSRDEERWAAVFRQVCTVNNKAKHRNGFDLMDLFLQITPKHSAIHFPPPPSPNKKRRWKTLGFVIQVIWGVRRRRFYQRDIVNQISACKFLIKLAKVRSVSPVPPINLDFPIGLLWTLLPRRWLSLYLDHVYKHNKVPGD